MGMHRPSIRALLGVGALVVSLAACSSAPSTRGRAADEASSPARPEPYPYTTPTPPAAPTALDGTWVREVAEEEVGGSGKCRRCPPYRLAPGEDTLELHRGVFRVSHEGTGYMAVGHYVVEGDRIVFFNDPNCSAERGTYAWTMEDGALRLEVVEDECAFGDVRVRFLTAVPWARRD